MNQANIYSYFKINHPNKWVHILNHPQQQTQLIHLAIMKDYIQNKLQFNSELLQFILKQESNNLYSEILFQWILNATITKEAIRSYYIPNQSNQIITNILTLSLVDNSIYNILLFPQNPSIQQWLLSRIFKNTYTIQLIGQQQLVFNPHYKIDLYQLEFYLLNYPQLSLNIYTYLVYNYPEQLFQFLNLSIILQLLTYPIQGEQLLIMILDSIKKNQQQFNVFISEMYLILEREVNFIYKQKIVNILIKLNQYNDTILNLGILEADHQLQYNNEQIFIDQWSQSQQFKKQLWNRFQSLLSSGAIILDQFNIKVSQSTFLRQSLISTLFLLIRNETSKYILTNSQNNIMIQYQKYFLQFPEIFLAFVLLDKSKLLVEDTNILILKSLTLIISKYEKKQQNLSEGFYIKLSLCHFLIQCLSSTPSISRSEINIFQFIHQIFIQNHTLLMRFVLDTFQNVEKVVNHLECLHIVMNEYESLTIQHSDRMFLRQLFYFLDLKYKTELSEKALKFINDKLKIDKIKKQQDTNQILTTKQKRTMIQLY